MEPTTGALYELGFKSLVVDPTANGVPQPEKFPFGIYKSLAHLFVGINDWKKFCSFRSLCRDLGTFDAYKVNARLQRPLSQNVG